MSEYIPSRFNRNFRFGCIVQNIILNNSDVSKEKAKELVRPVFDKILNQNGKIFPQNFDETVLTELKKGKSSFKANQKALKEARKAQLASAQLASA